MRDLIFSFAFVTQAQYQHREPAANTGEAKRVGGFAGGLLDKVAHKLVDRKLQKQLRPCQAQTGIEGTFLQKRSPVNHFRTRGPLPSFASRILAPCDAGDVAREVAAGSIHCSCAMECNVEAPQQFVAWPFAYQEEVEVRIEKLTDRGMGVGCVRLSPGRLAMKMELPVPERIIGRKNRWERKAKSPKVECAETSMRIDGRFLASERKYNDTSLWEMVVPFSIPGELVRVRVTKNVQNYSEVDLVSVLEASEHRLSPRCRVFGQCGGCQYQHIALMHQREWKRRHVQGFLDDAGVRLPLGVHVQTSLGSEHAYGYRSKLTPHYDRPNPVGGGTIEAIGFKKLASPIIVDVVTCDVATPAINAALPAARITALAHVRSSFARGETPVGNQLLFRDTTDGVMTDKKSIAKELVRGLQFHVPAHEFFQNNPYALPLLIEHVLSEATAPIGGGSAPRFLIDAYCGGGLFAVSAAEFFEKCFGVEISGANVRSAKRNAKLNKISNCVFLQATASAIFAAIPPEVGSAMTSVIIDPPRKGCDVVFLRQLLRYAPARIVYVSCDPATQVRDARVLLEGGDYEIRRVQPVDLFPQTRHIENIITFDRSLR